jgi:hypothetical protein
MCERKGIEDKKKDGEQKSHSEHQIKNLYKCFRPTGFMKSLREDLQIFETGQLT